MVDQVNQAVEYFRTRCEILIVLGIGGSALGNIALQNALNPYTYNLASDRTRSGPQLFVLDNVDPDQIRSVVDLITPKIKKTIDIDQLLEGAADMDKRIKGGDLFANPSAMIAAIHYLLDQRGKNMAVMMPYSTALYSCADWFRQLWAESLGKQDGLKKKKVYAGQTPIKALGTTDQHSQVQLYREGPNDKIFTFLEVEKFHRPLSIPDTMKDVESLNYLANSSFQTLITNEKIATEYALMESDRPTATVIFPRISAHTVGQFLYMYEVAVSYMGALFEINTYDQPGVELGKKATFALMGRPGYEKMKKEISPVAEKSKKHLI